MPRNGVGMYTRPAGGQIITGTTITKVWGDTSLDDIGTALTGSLASDGQTNPTANLPMATFRHTGVGNGVARTDYSAVGQIQDGSLIWCGTATGTANALILTATPTITAVTAGMTLRFKASASANTNATTVTIGSAAAIAVQVNGAACAGGEILANKWYQITVDASTTSCQLLKLGPLADMTATVGGAVPTPPNDTTKFLRGDGTWAVTTSGGTYLRKTANYTAVASDAILASTTGGAWTLTLPAAPAQFDRIGPIVDTDGTFATNNLTIGRNGLKIMGLSEDMIVSQNNASFSLEYDNASNGWRLF